MNNNKYNVILLKEQIIIEHLKKGTIILFLIGHSQPAISSLQALFILLVAADMYMAAVFNCTSICVVKQSTRFCGLRVYSMM